ncbi:MAG: glycerol-3-phosphate dehydrogenase/oxidase [Bacteroidota bacterium]
MQRSELIGRLRESGTWDVLVIGGGATGLGVAVDAATRGYKTLLLEQSDFAKGTSSRSTKLVHGGVRYLRQGNVSLVIEALRERGLMRQNAPHLVRNLGFVVPNYDWWEGPFYGIGMKVYDMLAGKLGLGPSKLLSREETLSRLPTIEPEGLRGGVVYYDAQFDDSRLAVNLAQTALDHGATVVNYVQVTGLMKQRGLIDGVEAQDAETGETFRIAAKAVVNATGVFTDGVRRMDEPGRPGIIQPSQGVHIVLDRRFLPTDHAIMVPQTDDGRVLFAIPWHDVVVVGTTDTPVPQAELEPKPLEDELDFLVTHAARYLTEDPDYSDVLSTFAGLRPLVKAGGDGNDTASISRDHTLIVSNSGLVTIAGGKWTTYRKMAQDTVDMAVTVGLLPSASAVTEDLKIHGWSEPLDPSHPLAVYGSDIEGLQALINESPDLEEKLHPELPYTRAEVVWAARHELARTVDDVLARRTRAILLNARASIEAAPMVASLLAETLGHNGTWAENQVETYTAIASGYLVG